MQHKQSVLFITPSYRQQEAKWSSRGLHPTTYTLWPMRQKTVSFGIKALRAEVPSGSFSRGSISVYQFPENVDLDIKPLR